MLNALTIDVEDYFQVQAFSKCIRYEDWERYECRVERNTKRLLEILYSFSREIKATFFVLGWIAERYPGLVRDIREQGHEIASHGYNHQVISSMSPDQFREDVRRSKSILEDITGEIISGYRAPTYSITEKQFWALEILAEEGYTYDSSIFPIRHDNYGIPHAPRFPFDVRFPGNGKKKSIVEFPLSTIRLLNTNFPISGGGYFRLFPYGVIKKALKWINVEEKKGFIFYLHPWEIDLDQPTIRGAGIRSRIRHYVNLEKTEERFKKLVTDFAFCSVRQIIDGEAKEFPQRAGSSAFSADLLPHELIPQLP